MTVKDWLDRFFDRSYDEESTSLVEPMKIFDKTRKDELCEKYGLSEEFFNHTNTDGVYLNHSLVSFLDETDEALVGYGENEAWFFETIALRKEQITLIDLNRHVRDKHINVIIFGKCDLILLLSAFKHVNINRLTVIDGPILDFNEFVCEHKDRRISHFTYILSHRNPFLREFVSENTPSDLRLTVVPVCMTDDELSGEHFPINLDGIYAVLSKMKSFLIDVYRMSDAVNSAPPMRPSNSLDDLSQLGAKYQKFFRSITPYDSTDVLTHFNTRETQLSEFRKRINEGVLPTIHIAETILRMSDRLEVVNAAGLTITLEDTKEVDDIYSVSAKLIEITNSSSDFF